MEMKLEIDVPFKTCKNCNKMTLKTFHGEHYCDYGDFCRYLVETHKAYINGKDKDKSTPHFGNNMKKICKEHRITLADVADGTGIARSSIYNITKRNTKKPRGDKVQRIFAYLKERVPDLTMEDLMKGE